MLRLHFTHLLHVGGELGLLLKDELHGAAHFLVGHVLPFRELWLKDTTPLIVSPERRLFHKNGPRTHADLAGITKPLLMHDGTSVP